MTALWHLDTAAFLAVNHAFATPHLAWLVRLLDRADAGDALWFGIGLLFFLFGGRAGRRLALIAAAATLIAAFAADTVVQGLVQRPRPFDPTQLGQLAHVVGPRPGGSSFPSGRAAAAFAAASVLGRAGDGWATALWLLALLVGVARVGAGVAFPADVAGGWLVGLFAAWLAARLLGQPRPLPPRRRRRLPRVSGD